MSARPILAHDELLLELVAKVDALAVQVAEIHAAIRVRKSAHPAQAEAELVRCVGRFAGARRFSTWALLDHCTLPDSGELRDAIRAAVGSENGKKLGRLLKRLENVDLDGLRVIRDGDEGGTARWRVSGFETP